MDKERVIYGRTVTPQDVRNILGLIRKNPDWSRRRLSRELCAIWGWRDAKGQLRDIACRTLLLRLHRASEIVLPVACHNGNNERRYSKIEQVLHDTTAIDGSLSELRALELIIPRQNTAEDDLFKCLIERYHYLGFKHVPGENMRYMAFDSRGRPVACLLFAAAAWRVSARDEFIGWSTPMRETNPSLITNNARFLILPWVQVKCLASHVLSKICRRIRCDWLEKYGHPVHLLETFVDRSRYRGVCYQAANWINVGRTVGRTRNDRQHRIKSTIKDVYVYALNKHFRKRLCQ
jgi:hypothetical protein